MKFSLPSRTRSAAPLLAFAFTASFSACAGPQAPTTIPGDLGVQEETAASVRMAEDDPLVRDWQQCPAIAEIDDTGDLLVVGDVHGDWEKLRDLLVGAEVIERPSPSAPGDAKWTAGNASLVLVGDFTGKWPHALDVVEFLWTLDEQALAQGGRVLATMGNHEAEILAPQIVDGEPQWAKKTDLFRREMIDAGLDPADVWQVRGSEESRRLGTYLRCLPLGAVSGDWFLSHAGSTGGRTLDDLRRAIEDGVDADGYDTPVLLDPVTGLLDARLSPDPPADIWWQKLPESQKKSKKRLEGYAEALGVRHLVIGHQSNKYTFHRDLVRKKARVFQLFGGTLYLVDVGMSRGQKGGLSAGALLHVERNDGKKPTVTVVCPDGRRRPLPPKGKSDELRCKNP